jgi:hypothetical protein
MHTVKHFLFLCVINNISDDNYGITEEMKMAFPSVCPIKKPIPGKKSGTSRKSTTIPRRPLPRRNIVEL